jgi:hypothetical protein
MVSSSRTAVEVKQMGQGTQQDTIKGSPELALIVFAFMAVFAYVLS